MISALKKRFIYSSMLAVSLLLIILLGGINIFNAYYSSMQSDRLLMALPGFEMIASPDFRFPFMNRPPDEDSKMSALYFSVRLDREGFPLFADTSRIASVNEELAMELSRSIDLENTGIGRLSGYKYRVISRPDGERTVLFLDTAQHNNAVIRLGLLSLLGGGVCWLLMLFVVILLSNHAIKPIAENFEKQRRFVTDAGHELKTPLAIILANTEAMEMRQGESKYSRNIRNQVSRLDSLTKNLLTLSRADEQKVASVLEEIDLSALCREALQEFQVAAELKKLSLESSLHESAGFMGDREQMRQLVSILLDNAVKYAPEGGKILVSLEKSSRIQLKIKNSVSSAEIPPEQMFDRFYRGDSSRSQKSGGYGIGLSAALAIAKLHGGTLSAEYEDENTICFTLTI